MEYRTCNKCKKLLPISEFHKDRSNKDGLQARCKKCVIQDKNSWMKRNPEKRAAQQKRYHEKHTKQESEYKKRWGKLNPDKLKIYREKKKKSGKENVYQLKYRMSEYGRDKKRVYTRNRRSILKGAEGSFTKMEWDNLKEKYNYTCLRCGKSEPEVKLTIDHVIPISLGGTNYITNIQPLCCSCNASKNDGIIDYRF